MPEVENIPQWARQELQDFQQGMAVGQVDAPKENMTPNSQWTKQFEVDISLYIIRVILQNLLVCNGENSRFMTAARTTDFYRFVSSLSYHRQGRKMMIDSLVESLFHNKLC